MKITGAQATIEALLREGADVVFGYPGGAILPIYDALHINQERIRHILVRHEQGAAMAAEGYSKSSGKVGVCMATSGPGATNLVTGIADAMLDSVPLVCITGQVASHLIGTDAFQEADIIGITIPITKWNIQVTRAEDIPAAISKAFYYAQDGRPGPVVVDITRDAQAGMMEFKEYVYYKPSANKIPRRHSDMQFIEIADLLNSARRPLIFAGNGVGIANAEQDLIDLAEKANIPVACTLHGLHSFPSNHELFAGILGMHGNYAPNILTNDADVILAIGMRFDDRVTGNLARYAKQAKIIHVDIDQAEINKNVRSHMHVLSDAKYAITNIARFVQPNDHKEWKDKLKSLAAEEKSKVVEPELSPSNIIRMSQAMTMVSQKTEGKAIVVPDVGQNQMIAMRYYKFQQPKSHISSGGLGTMGFALPAAVGAKVANPDREVICVAGDGGIQMNIQELGVIMQEKLPVKILLLNNNYLGMVRQWQEMFYEKRYSFVDLVNPNFCALANAYGIKSRQVSNPAELEAAIDEMLASKEAYLLEVIVEKREKVFPMIPAGSAVDEIRLS